MSNQNHERPRHFSRRAQHEPNRAAPNFLEERRDTNHFVFRGNGARGGNRYGDPHRGHYNHDYRDHVDQRDNREDLSGGSHGRHQDNYRSQEQFSFRPQGQPSLRFPSPNRQGASPPRAPRRPYRHDEDRRSRGHYSMRGSRGSRSIPARAGFRPRPANSRAILSKSVRDTTPEQLQGMNDEGLVRFKIDASNTEESDSGDEDESASDTPLDSRGDDGEDDGEVPRKKLKTEDGTAFAPPRWSNPDPYTALPPPDSLGAPKKDIVKLIRKAKLDAAPKQDAASAVATNADFISFDVDDGQILNLDASGDGVAGINNASGPLQEQTNARDSLHSHQSRRVADHSQHALVPYSRTPSPIQPVALCPTVASNLPNDEQARTALIGETNERKRKRGAGRLSGEVLDEWFRNDSNPTPWLTQLSAQALVPALRLHMEICDFYNYVKPEPFEQTVRHGLVCAVERAVRGSRLPNASTIDVECFGSFAAGLYLPTADMDLVAVSPGFMSQGLASFCQSKNSLHKLGAALRQMARPGELSVVARAKVPIVKFTDRRSGLKVDISVENRTGLDAIKTFETWKAKYPAMPVLVMIIKQLVAMRGLNEVFTGGIGGFTIICLVTSMLQLMPDQQAQQPDSNPLYGDLLLRFLDLYGNNFDIRRTGIRMSPPGYFDKKRNPMPKQNMERLTIQDPNNDTNDISGGSHMIEMVLEVFRQAHDQLQRRLASTYSGDTRSPSILGVILGGNYSSFERQRGQLRNMHEATATLRATQQTFSLNRPSGPRALNAYGSSNDRRRHG